MEIERPRREGPDGPDGSHAEQELVREPAREQRNVRSESSKGFHRGAFSRRPKWAIVLWSWFAWLVDALLMFAVFCFFALVAIALLKMQLLGPEGVSTAEGGVLRGIRLEWSWLGYYALMHSSYLLMTRVFFGCTIGEWACDLRLGDARHRLADDYSLRVLGRFVLVVATGFVGLPIVSLFMGYDVAGRLTGLSLISYR